MDVFVEIAKYCDGNTLVSLTRTCRDLASKYEYNTDMLTIRCLYTGLICNQPKNRISINLLWRSAAAYQFPCKKHIPAFGDEENYFIAKTKKFMVLRKENGDISDIFEYDDFNYRLLKESYEDYSESIIRFKIKKRYLLVDDNTAYSFSTQMAAELWLLDKFGIGYNQCVLLDLKNDGLNLFRHDEKPWYVDEHGEYSLTHKHYNQHPIADYDYEESESSDI